MDNNIIAKVTTPTKWINPIIIVPKQDGNIRICLDSVYINKATKRKIHYLPTLKEILQKKQRKQVFHFTRWT